jgi:hypothetical protein
VTTEEHTLVGAAEMPYHGKAYYELAMQKTLIMHKVWLKLKLKLQLK